MHKGQFHQASAVLAFGFLILASLPGPERLAGLDATPLPGPPGIGEKAGVAAPAPCAPSGFVTALPGLSLALIQSACPPCEGLCDSSADFYHTCMDNPGMDPEDCMDEYDVYLGWCMDCACLECGQPWCGAPE